MWAPHFAEREGPMNQDHGKGEAIRFGIGPRLGLINVRVRIRVKVRAWFGVGVGLRVTVRVKVRV